MADIVSLKTERAEIRQDVLSLLATALEEATEGQVLAVGIAVVRPGSHINCAFTNFDNAGLLLGAVALLQSRVIANITPKT